MHLHCPHCGPRGHEEFAYHGDASMRRPDATETDAAEAFDRYAHLRENPAGPHRELWYHGQGCQAWLVVERDTLTHEVTRVTDVRSTGDAP